MTVGGWVAVAVAVAAGLVVAGLPVRVTYDEAWSLQVVERVRRGEVLYRDVFYGAGPLAVWLAVWAVRATRPQVLVLRAIGALYHVALIAVGSVVLDLAGGGPVVVAGFCLLSLGMSGPAWGTGNAYGQLALLGVVLGVAAALRWGATGDAVWVLAAGAAAGVALSAKQNVGFVAAAGLGLFVALRGDLPADGARFGVAAGVVVVVSLLPVIRAGAFGDYVLRSFRNKRTYLATGAISPRAGMALPFLSRPDHGVVATLAAAVQMSAFLVLPAAALAGAAGAVVLDAEPGSAAAAMALVVALASMAAAAPRVDPPHVQQMFPLGLLAALLALQAVRAAGWTPPPALAWGAGVPLGAWSVLALVVALDTPHRIRFPADLVSRRVPHFRGVTVAGYRRGADPGSAAALREATGGRVFVLRPDAAFWYLADHLTNPTPYDYPYASTFGPRGQAEVIRRIQAGDIEWVLWAGPVEGPLQPVELDRFVAESMEPVVDTPAGTLFRVPAGERATEPAPAVPAS